MASLPPPLDLSYVNSASLPPAHIKQWRRKFSILDLCAFDSLTIIIGPDSTWDEKAAGATDVLEKRGMKCCIVKLGRDFEVLKDRKNWVHKMGLEDGKAVVVRPDQHILFLAETEYKAKDIIDRVLEFFG
jgi:hypothetical protein